MLLRFLTLFVACVMLASVTVYAERDVDRASRKIPCWYMKALQETRNNVREDDHSGKTLGAPYNLKIMQYFTDIGAAPATSQSPWAAAFVGAMLERCDVKSTRSVLNRSYLDNKSLFEDIHQAPFKGVIVVFKRGVSRMPPGNIGFYHAYSATTVTVIAGDQGGVGRVKLHTYPRKDVAGYVWPLGVEGGNTNGNCARRAFSRYQCRSPASCVAVGGQTYRNKGCASEYQCCVVPNPPPAPPRRTTGRDGNPGLRWGRDGGGGGYRR